MCSKPVRALFSRTNDVQGELYSSACSALRNRNSEKLCATEAAASLCLPGDASAACGTSQNIAAHNTKCISIGGSNVCKCAPGWRAADASTSLSQTDAKCENVNECTELPTTPCDVANLLERNACRDTQGCGAALL